MKHPLRIALIGVGGVGQTHLAAIESLALAGKVLLTSVADPMDGTLSSVRSSLEARGVRWYRHYDDLLRFEDELDFVTIAAPIAYHEEMTLACINRKLHVNLEKPPVPLLHQLEKLIGHDTDNRVGVGFQMIASEPIQRLKDVLVKGGLGEIHEIRAGGCWPRTDAYYNRAAWAGRLSLRDRPVFDGPATNALAHVLHNIMFLAARERDGFETPTSVQGELYRARPIQSYDVACLRGEFRSGVIFSAAFTHATDRELPSRIEIRGRKGWAKLSANGTRFETSDGQSFGGADTFLEGIERYYHRAVDFAAGSRDRMDTRLRDARGYLAATNAMLISSGGVREIGQPWVSTFGEGDAGGFKVAGLYEAIDAFFETGRMFSESALPWAVGSRSVKTEDIDLRRCLELLEVENITD